MTGLIEEPYLDALRSFFDSKLRSRIRAIVVVSAHTTAPDRMVEVTLADQHQLIYDFSGFPPELYQIQWEARGDDVLSARIGGMLSDAGFQVSFTRRGLDHGVWVPLRVVFPKLEVPLIQVSLPYPAQPEIALLMGKTLAALRREGVLLIGSGGAVHNLRKLVWSGKHSAPIGWAREFDSWVIDALARKDVQALLDFEASAPQAELAHPTTEHFQPIFFSVGGALPGDEAVIFHREIQYGTLSMLCFALQSTLRA